MQNLGVFEIPFWQQAVKVLAVLSGLVGALLLGAHLLKKCRSARLGTPSLIRLLETRYLTPKSSLHLVAVGPARYLVGSTGERMTLLTALPPEQDAIPQGSKSGASPVPLVSEVR